MSLPRNLGVIAKGIFSFTTKGTLVSLYNKRNSSMLLWKFRNQASDLVLELIDNTIIT